jgi:ABC-type multidrug transport system fused ATPase/permease subunit
MALLEPPQELLRLLREAIPEEGAAPLDLESKEEDTDNTVLSYVAFLAAGLADAHEFDVSLWQNVLQPYLEDNVNAVRKDSAAGVVERYCRATEQALMKPEDDTESYGGDDEGAEELCNLRFNLAYGGKILLHQTKLHLLRGRRYALVGKNGVGKYLLNSHCRIKRIIVCCNFGYSCALSFLFQVKQL